MISRHNCACPWRKRKLKRGNLFFTYILYFSFFSLFFGIGFFDLVEFHICVEFFDVSTDLTKKEKVGMLGWAVSMTWQMV